MPIIHLNSLMFPDYSASMESKIGATNSVESHAPESSFRLDAPTENHEDDIAGKGAQCKEQKLQSSSQDQKVNPITACSSTRFKPLLASHKKNVTYPFQLLKPGGFDGETTLEDINKLIRMKPSASKAIPHPVRNSVTNPCKSTRDSSISGKEVACRTIIPTQGGGSITIIRTND